MGLISDKVKAAKEKKQAAKPNNAQQQAPAQSAQPQQAAAQQAPAQQANVQPGQNPALASIATSQANYNNSVPAQGNPQANQGVALPEESSVETEHREKVARPMLKYRYKIINTQGKKEDGTFDAESENDVRNFLLSQDYQVLEIKERDKFDIDIGTTKLKAADLSFSLTQLSTYLKAGIPLADAVRILAKQSNKKALKKSFQQLVYQLLKGESFSDAMVMQGDIYPKLLINMVRTAEMTGDLPAILDDMSEYYTSMDQTRKQMKSAMTYPVVVLVIAFGVLIFMLTYLVPQFATMFQENDAEMPALTNAILAISAFVKTKWYLIILVVGLIVGGFIYIYKKYKGFRTKVQIVLMHLPVVKNIIIYNEIANFTKTFASLLNHGVFITDSMEILSKITNNEIMKEIIGNCLTNLARGDTVSSAFKGQWAIPVVAYEMIVTGETTGQLGNMMEKVAAHFQMLHKNVIDQMKSLVEPIMICFLAVVVGIILLSIIQPMFSIYSQIK